ncbi:MAG: hypothetical protein ACO1QB_14125 [Verrucomicrobiales bacterium]
MKRSILPFISLLVLLGLAGPASAFPLEPRSLLQMVKDSPVIVVGRVEANRRKDALAFHGTSPVKITVYKVLKATVPQKEIFVYFFANATCPMPSNYPAGETVITFLDRSRGRYETVAMSYGVLYGKHEELRDYVVAINEFNAALEAYDPYPKITELLVKHAEHPLLKDCAAMELLDRKTLLGKLKPSEYKSHLTDDHYKRLSNVVFQAKSIGSAELKFLKLFEKKSPEKAFRLLIAALKNESKKVNPDKTPTLDPNQPWTTYDIMERLLEIFPDAEAEKFLSQYSKLSFVLAGPGASYSFAIMLENAAIKSGFLNQGSLQKQDGHLR